MTDDRVKRLEARFREPQSDKSSLGDEGEIEEKIEAVLGPRQSSQEEQRWEERFQRVTYYLSKDLVAELRTRAKLEHISTSRLVNESIIRGLRRD